MDFHLVAPIGKHPCDVTSLFSESDGSNFDLEEEKDVLCILLLKYLYNGSLKVKRPRFRSSF